MISGRIIEGITKRYPSVCSRSRCAPAKNHRREFLKIVAPVSELMDDRPVEGVRRTSNPSKSLNPLRVPGNEALPTQQQQRPIATLYKLVTRLLLGFARYNNASVVGNNPNDLVSLVSIGERLKLWGDGFDVASGNLDETLKHAHSLRTRVISALRSIGKILVRSKYKT